MIKMPYAFSLLVGLSVAAVPAPIQLKKAPALCKSTPNCVSSFDTRKGFYISPVSYTKSKSAVMTEIKRYLEDQARVKIKSEEGSYIHAVFTSSLMGFDDDVEVFIRDGKVHFRSASRVGYSDMGVNRERVERMRGHLQKVINY